MARITDLQAQKNKNSAAWHSAKTQAEKDRLHQENIKLQQQIDSMSGGKSSFNSYTGKWTTSGGSSSGASRPTQPTTTTTNTNTAKPNKTVSVKGQGTKDYWSHMTGGTDYSRRPDLAGQTLSQNGVNVTYDKDGYAIKGLHYDHDLFSGTDKGVAAPSKDRYDSTADRGSWGGSSYDQAHFSDADLQNAAFYRDQAQKGNISWAQANNMVNEIRKKYGYTGGTDGSGYKPIEVNVYDPDREEGQEYQRGTYRPANGVIPGAVPTAGSGSVAAGGRPGGYGPTYGTDANGDVDFSVLIRDAMAAGADAQTVQDLLNARVDKATQNGYLQWAYDDLYQQANQYIQNQMDMEMPQIPQVEDLSGYLEGLYSAQREAALAAIRKAYEQNMAVSGAAKDQIAPKYQDARNQAAGTAEQAARNWAEYAAASGLGSGSSAQADLARNIALQNSMADLDSEEADAFAQLELQMNQAEIEYNNAIAQAEANSNSEMAAALYQEKVRVQNALIAQQQALFEQSLAKKQFQFQQQQANIANKQWQMGFDAEREQEERQNAEKNRSYLASWGESMLENGFMPSDDMLDAMGISADQAKVYINFYQQAAGQKSRSGGGYTAGSGDRSADVAPPKSVTQGSPTIDMNSVLQLGYGPIDSASLEQLEAQGKVESYVDGNLIKFRKRGTASAPSPFSLFGR